MSKGGVFCFRQKKKNFKKTRQKGTKCHGMYWGLFLRVFKRRLIKDWTEGMGLSRPWTGRQRRSCSRPVPLKRRYSLSYLIPKASLTWKILYTAGGQGLWRRRASVQKVSLVKRFLFFLWQGSHAVGGGSFENKVEALHKEAKGYLDAVRGTSFSLSKENIVKA
jgi:hypothetical protein